MIIFNREIFLPRFLRTTLAYFLAPLLMVTGFRFSKDYRWNTTRLHGFVYACVNTIAANRLADTLRPPSYLR